MKKILLLLFGSCSVLLQAQESPRKTFSWGILAGIEQHRLSIQSIPSKVSTPGSLAAGVIRSPSPGVVFGSFGRWQLTRDLVIQSELLFSSARNNILFFPENIVEKYRFADLEVPLYLVVTNGRKIMPLRASFLLGGRIGWNFVSQNSDKLNLLSERLAIDVGLGVEIRLKRLRLKPEVVYSYGLNNLHDYQNTPYDPGISSIVRDRITFRVLVWR